MLQKCTVAKYIVKRCNTNTRVQCYKNTGWEEAGVLAQLGEEHVVGTQRLQHGVRVESRGG